MYIKKFGKKFLRIFWNYILKFSDFFKVILMVIYGTSQRSQMAATHVVTRFTRVAILTPISVIWRFWIKNSLAIRKYDNFQEILSIFFLSDFESNFTKKLKNSAHFYIRFRKANVFWDNTTFWGIFKRGWGGGIGGNLYTYIYKYMHFYTQYNTLLRQNNKYIRVSSNYIYTYIYIT